MRELLYDSARTRVERDGQVIRKRPLRSEAAERLRNELDALRRLDGVPGVPRLAPEQEPGELATIGVEAAVLGETPLPWDAGRLVDLGCELAGVLAAVHRHGVIHRDVSPANVLIPVDGGPPVLIDFEFATTQAAESDDLVGTLAYLAPEQTGRTGRPVDHRADLYALGATLYELATGEPPFGRDRDALRLIHDHLARVPEPPDRVNPRIPGQLAAILLRLLSKEPEQRYQSAEGLAADLARLSGDDTGFPLGERDFPMRLRAPERLVGRDEPLRLLHGLLSAARAGERAMALVTGPPGVGKTALIHRLRPAVAAAGGRFVSGKFDQYRRDQGADAIRQVFWALGTQLLAEPDAEVTRLRAALLGALGPNAGLAAAVVPPFAALLGVEPEESSDPWTTATRIREVGRAVLRTVAGPACPIVIFVDDLQWAGPSAFGFLDDVLDGGELAGVLVVGAYRESEVDEAHPLGALIARLRQAGAGTAELRLENLPPGDLSGLLAEMLRLPVAEAAPLADAVASRTLGNPFDTVELVNALRREGALVPEGDRWLWEPGTLRRFVGRGDVVDLLGARIEALPPSSRELLEAMSCLGGEVASDLLCRAADRPAEAVTAGLLPAAEDGLVVVGADENPVVAFRHDRVQQAACGRLSESRRTELALLLARRLATEPDYHVAAAEQYLVARTLLVKDDERAAAADLFRHAAAAARAYTNYAAAETFLAAAVDLLGPDSHDVQAAWHASLCSLSRFADADEIFARLAAADPDPVRLARVRAEQIVSLTSRGRFREAVDLGLSGLGSLGVPVPEPGGFDERIAAGLPVFRDWLAEGGAEADLRRPIITDPRLLAVARLVNRVFTAAFFVDERVVAWVMTLAFEIWSREGVSAELIGAVGQVGLTAALFTDPRDGYEAGRRIIEVGTARGWEPGTSQARWVQAVAGIPFFEPIENGVRLAHEACQGLLRGGDLANAGATVYASVPQTLDSADLDAYTAELDAAQALCERIGYDHAMFSLLAHRLLLRALRGETPVAGRLGGDDFDEAAFRRSIEDNPLVLCWFETVRAIAAAVYGDDEALAFSGAAALDLAYSLPGTYVVAQANLVAALGAAVQARVTADADVRRKALDLLAERSEFFAVRAQAQPANYAHLHRFVSATLAWARDDFAAAVREFDAALDDVASVHRPWHAALIAEHAGLFHLAYGMEHAGQRLLADAFDAYQAWGAHGKVRQLAQRYPQLAGRSQAVNVAGPQSVSMSTDVIDLIAVLEAARVLSSETDPDSLRRAVEDVLGAMTGATGVRLLVHDPVAGWILPPALALDDAGTLLPVSAVRYAERTGEPLLVDDAARDDRVSRDPYLAGSPHWSLLVVPVLSQGVLRAVLVLENRLTRQAFTTARLQAVTMLAGQLAVSLDNAQLYASLERKVGERTEELAEANRRLAELSVTDPLTGLFNRRRLDETLEAEWLRAVRPGDPLGLAMIDIDHFKKYNDHYGHQGGDECLRLVAGVLRDNVRASDLVARYGGEEFCIVMPGADAEQALVAGERVCAAVAALREPHAAAGSGFVTISVGVASVRPQPGSVPEQLVKLADEALYAAKQGGRNRATGS